MTSSAPAVTVVGRGTGVCGYGAGHPPVIRQPPRRHPHQKTQRLQQGKPGRRLSLIITLHRETQRHTRSVTPGVGE